MSGSALDEGTLTRRGARDEYRVVGHLDTGGMGAVYLAIRQSDGCEVALKVLHPHLSKQRDYIDMFVDEARVTARIEVPHVVRVIDSGQEHKSRFVAMDYVEGATLGDLLSEHGHRRLSAAIATILHDALLGLDAAHLLTDDEGRALNLVHRDVTPSNILVGSDGVSRIIDFGVARMRSRVVQTQPGHVRGKAPFVAPEQIIDDAPVDSRADIFSAGAVLWSALTGHPLFAEEQPVATMRNVLTKEVPRPSGVGLKPPEAFDQVCLRALERDPDKRYQRASDMAAALEEALASSGHELDRSLVADYVADAFGANLEQRRKAIERALASSEAKIVELGLDRVEEPEHISVTLSGTHPLADAATAEQTAEQTGPSRALLVGVSLLSLAAIACIALCL